nr:polysaccharide pyruvyl transferase family protein [uncultured Desulfobacter sp.]
MKVGIVTIHNHYNYGAVLQAFALNFVIRKLGHDCKTINCNLEPGENRLAIKAKNPGAKLTKLYNLLRWSSNRRFNSRFKDFITNYIPVSDIQYNDFASLRENPPQFDAYITGSDQVWRPSFLDKEIGQVFHLSFVNPEISRLIAYAPSFGIGEIPEQYKNQIRSYLQRYDFLSIREKHGGKMIKDLTGKAAVHVVDPTLLLSKEEYEKIIQPSKISKNYILVYAMELGKEMAFLGLVKKVKLQLKLPVVCVFPVRFDFRWLKVADKIMLDAGPKEFIGLIRDSTLVCTNSFHGTVFSIKFQKNFVGFPHSVSNSRIESLLEAAGLQNRQIQHLTDDAIERELKINIDYESVNEKMQVKLNNSMAFLQEAMG